MPRMNKEAIKAKMNKFFGSMPTPVAKVVARIVGVLLVLTLALTLTIVTALHVVAMVVVAPFSHDAAYKIFNNLANGLGS